MTEPYHPGKSNHPENQSGSPLPEEGMLLDLCKTSSRPLERILDLLLQALGARLILHADLDPARFHLATGRRRPGKPIPRAGRFLRPDLAETIRREGKPLLRNLDRNSGIWFLGWPLPLPNEPRAALFAWGRAPICSRTRETLKSLLDRLAPWFALARELGEHRKKVKGGREAGGVTAKAGRAAVDFVARLADSTLAQSGEAGRPPGKERGSWSAALVFPEIIAHAPAMQEVLRTAALVAPSDAAVLIEGESGTGKELIARAIHRLSGRARGPFTSENCAACPEGLQESEFFGVERGAFTGAHRTKPGLLERAHGGTLFLDEIGEMDFALQRKLLRALQEREVRRVGGDSSIPVDFRLISATNRVLSEEARSGRFRADLLYRIEVVKLRLPPLRERREDIPHLVRSFLSRHARSAELAPPPVADGAMRLLCEYSWPGNVRELENEMWRAVALRVETITPLTLSMKITRAGREAVLVEDQVLRQGRSLEEIERELLGGLIREVLRRTGGNKIRAAQLLRIPKTSLYRRLRRYSILEPPGR